MQQHRRAEAIYEGCSIEATELMTSYFLRTSFVGGASANANANTNARTILVFDLINSFIPIPPEGTNTLEFTTSAAK